MTDIIDVKLAIKSGELKIEIKQISLTKLQVHLLDIKTGERILLTEIDTNKMDRLWGY